MNNFAVNYNKIVEVLQQVRYKNKITKSKRKAGLLNLGLIVCQLISECRDINSAYRPLKYYPINSFLFRDIHSNVSRLHYLGTRSI